MEKSVLVSGENPYELLYYLRFEDSFAMKELLRIYQPAIMCLTRAALPLELGAYEDDLAQEAMIALLDAAECYREDKDCGFSTFATLVIRRRISSLILRYQRRMQYENAVYMSGDCLLCEGSRNTHADMVENRDLMSRPEFYLAYRLAEEKLQKILDSMKKEDRRILMEAAQLPYRDACVRNQMSCTSYGNKLYRLRAKVKRQLLKS